MKNTNIQTTLGLITNSITIRIIILIESKMVTNRFFVLSFCLHYALVLRSAEVSPNVPQNLILGRVECSARRFAECSA